MPSSYPSPALSSAAQQLFESPPLMNASAADPTTFISSQSGTMITSTYDYTDRFDVRRKFWPGPDERSFTDPDPSHLNIKKRIVLCCDGYVYVMLSTNSHTTCFDTSEHGKTERQQRSTGNVQISGYALLFVDGALHLLMLVWTNHTQKISNAINRVDTRWSVIHQWVF